jgi:agmatinase
VTARTFLGAAHDPTGVGPVRFAFLGAPEGTCGASDAAGAPAAVRETTWEQAYVGEHHHYDFDLGGALFPDGPLDGLLVDAGDAPPGHAITGRIEALLARGAVPLVVGGDDSVPFPVLRAYEPLGPVNVLHVDAHLDFREEVDGNRFTYSTHVRRIRELAWVGRIVQVGMRGVGSARPRDVNDAESAGNTIVPAEVLHEHPPGWLARQLPRDHPYVVTIDVDGLDPSIAPGTGYPQPGGLTWAQAVAPVRALARAGLLRGLIFTEHHPTRDVRGLTSLTIVRLMVNAMGYARRSGSFARGWQQPRGGGIASPAEVSR